MLSNLMTSLLERAEDHVQRSIGKGTGGSGGVAPELSAIEAFLPKTIETILDIGGNKGDWTRAAISRWGSRLKKIYIFEPSRHHLQSIAAIDDPRVTFVPAAIGSAPGTATLYSDAEGSGMASLTKRRLDHLSIDFNMSEKVDVITLDNFIQQNGIQHVDYAKFDIEGHELDAFKGAVKSFENKIFKTISFEFGGCNIDTRTFFQDFWYFLKPLGFDIYRLNRRGRAFRIDRYTEIHENFRHTNFIAVLPG